MKITSSKDMGSMIDFVLPGDVTSLEMERKIKEKSKLGKDFSEQMTIKIGFGLEQKDSDDIVSTVAGNLTFISPNRFYINCKRKRVIE